MQSTRHDATLALHASALPGHVLDVIVLTSDGGLLATLRDASGPEHALWHAPSADAAVDLLISGRCGILVADLGTLRLDAAGLLSRLHAQFPELVLMATGRRDEEASVASLVGDGRIYRFLHKPISPARGNLFLSAASRRYFEVRDTQPAMMSTVRTIARRPHKGKWIGGIAALLISIAGIVAWFVLRATDTPGEARAARAENVQTQNIADLLAAAKIAEVSDRIAEPRGNNAIEYYQAVLKLAPSDMQAAAGLKRVAAALENQVIHAIDARNPAHGAAALAALRRAEPNHGNLERLQGELIALSRSMHALPQLDVPERTRPSAKTETLLVPAVTSARAQDRPEKSVAAPHRVSPGLENPISAQPEASETSSDELAENPDALARLAIAQRLRERNVLLAPKGNNAFEYMQNLVAQYPDIEGVRTEQQRLAFTLLEATRTSMAANLIDDAARFLEAAEQLVPGMAAAQSLRAQLQVAQEERQFRQSIAETGTLKPMRPIQADYPREARLRGTEGWVDVEFTILPNGSTQDLTVREAEPRDLFDRSALEAIERARFEPFLKNGAPVKQRALLRVKYEIGR